MKRPLIATALAAATIFGSVVMLHAEEPSAPNPPPTHPGAATMAEGFGRDPSFPPPGPPRAEQMQGLELFDLAGKLAAAEIYIGIKPEQLEPWRAYTEALLDMVSSAPVQPSPPPEGLPNGPGAPPPPPGPHGEKSDVPSQVPGEALSAMVLQKAEKAKSLQGAIGTLKSKLTPEQIDKLSELDRALVRRPPPPHGHEPGHDAFNAPRPEDQRPKG